MIPIEGQPILTAAAMRAAEDRAIAAGSSVETLMERAGSGVAEAVRRLAAGAPVLVLCGPGNNGGDGYVAARVLREAAADVRVAALGDPRTEAAGAARTRWGGVVEPLATAAPAPVMVDCIFGTGLTRAIDEAAMAALSLLVAKARLAVAVDVPSGVDTDTGAALNAGVPGFAITLALGALKPAHVLQPAASACGTVRLIDIGLEREIASADRTIGRPQLCAPQPKSHKYNRGMVAVIGGTMPGAAALAVEAAMRAGAGYGLLFADAAIGTPHAVVRRAWSPGVLEAALAGKPSAAVVIGPGLGRDDVARAKLEAAMACGRPLVIDGDALHLLDRRDFDRFGTREDVVLTPHAGEFAALFGAPDGSKIDAARAAAHRAGATIVFKGADTVVAHRDGRTSVATASRPWLSTAGTGDVLAGVIGALLASGAADAAEAGVWMHSEAARRLGAAFIADDLVRALSAVRAAL